MSRNLVNTYPEDLEDTLGEEFVHFQKHLKLPEFSSQIKTKKANDKEKDSKVSVELQIYRLLHENHLQNSYPNVEIALRIYLSMMVTNCSGERSFSKLSLIKDRLRNRIGQGKLNKITQMSIEHELLHDMDTSTIIKKFAHAKARKKKLV